MLLKSFAISMNVGMSRQRILLMPWPSSGGEVMDYVRHCLLTERTDWSHHDGPRRKETYLKRSIQRARCIVEST